MFKYFFIFSVMFFIMHAGAFDLLNPGFENSRKSHEGYNGWFFSSADSSALDTVTVHSGDFSLKLMRNDSTPHQENRYWNDHAFVLQPLKNVRPDTIYTVKGFFRTEMRRGEAGFGIRYICKKMKLPDWQPIKFMPLTGSRDWTELFFTFRTPKDIESLRIFAGAENFRGKIWIDDFSFEEGAALPQIPAATDWNSALILKDFIPTGDIAHERQPAEIQTEVALLSPGHELWIRGTCFEPRMNTLQASVSGKSNGVFADDCVEIFIDSPRSGSSYYQFAVNANGAYYDGQTGDGKWDCPKLKIKAQKHADSWNFELKIPYTSLGYGPVEAEVGDKQIGFAVFRTRRASGTRETSSWQIWPQKLFGTPANFQAIVAGVKNGGGVYSYLWHGYTGCDLRPALAWQTLDPLYEELMTDEPMHKEGIAIGSCSFGRIMSSVSPGRRAFCLQHGMRLHYDEMAALAKRMKLAVYATSGPRQATFGSNRVESLLYRLLEKYQLPASVNPYLQYAGANRGYRFVPDAPSIRHHETTWFYPDSEVKKSYASHVQAMLTDNKDKIQHIVLGHEGRRLYFQQLYDCIRGAYMQRNPERWINFEKEAKKKYGSDKIGFPKSFAEAKPLERMVYQLFVLDEVNRGMFELSQNLRKIKPDVVLVSELTPNGLSPDMYELYPGTYDYVTQQMDWGFGANRQSVAYNCKVLTDLSGTPVRGGPHIEHYFVSLNPEEVNEVLSSVFRVGGEALQLWLCDWFGKTLSDFYGAPERVHEIANIFERYAEMRKLRFPKADTAVLYYNPDLLARGWFGTGGINIGHEEIFTVLGPRVRSWFKFVSEIKLRDGREKLQNYKAVYDPGAIYLDDDMFKRLTEYVKNGGVLVVGNPASYSLNIDGSKRDAAPLLGIRLAGKLPAPGAINVPGQKPLPSGDACRVEPVGEVRIIGRYVNGAPAITEHILGKGQVITFAASPFNSTIYAVTAWHDFFQSLQQELGCAVDHDIWRFRFPRATTPAPAQTPEGLQCLTGNSCYWVSDCPTEGPNAKVAFNYRYDQMPDLIEDPQCTKLIDRRNSLSAAPLSHIKTLEKNIDPWVAAWKSPEPATLTFEFVKPVSAAILKTWVHGDIPEVKVFGKVNGTLKQLAVLPRRDYDATDVRELTLKFSETKSDTFVLHLNKRQGEFFLAEVELWGQP